MKKLTIILIAFLVLDIVFAGYFWYLKSQVQPTIVSQETPQKQNKLSLPVSENRKDQIALSVKKEIRVDLGKQKLFLYENNNLIKSFIISSGAPETPTPKGEFKIFEKNNLTWSEKYQQFLPYALRFYGAYLIHEVPYDKSGVRDGLDKLGQPVSHGCIRLNLGEAEDVFKWAEIGTKVIIQN